ncbi:MAG: hypothetical protein ACHQZR_05925 [Candidatus Limnocylindrales bacterium]
MAVEAYLEVSPKRTFAGAVAWPGWCRSGRDEAAALQSLVDYGPRYRRVLSNTGLVLAVPVATDQLVLVGRVAGNAGTDFGVPSMPAPGDDGPLDAPALARQAAILRACWAALDRAAGAAAGRELTKGPRGGGREVPAILAHVADAEAGYLSRVAWRAPDDALARRSAVLEALTAVARLGTPPPRGPGGTRWPARYFARRVAWHALDHAWEIDDRTPG